MLPKSFGYPEASISARLRDLRKAKFVEAILSGADFQGATVDGADFTGANLTGVILTGIWCVGNTGGHPSIRARVVSASSVYITW